MTPENGDDVTTVIEVAEQAVLVDVLEQAVTVIDIVQAGPQGPPGPPGGGGLVYVQSTPASTWVIPHALNRPPVVLLLNTAGKRIVGDEYPSATSLTVIYSVPVAGSAVLI